MSVRAVLAVVFAFALVATAQPAVDHATRTRDDASLHASADRVADAVTALHRRSDPGPTLATAPRRTLTLDVPTDATLAVREQPPLVVFRLARGTDHRRTLPVRVATSADDATLDGRVTLAYLDRTDGPVVLAIRGFIPGDAARPAHAWTPRPLRGERPRMRV